MAKPIEANDDNFREVVIKSDTPVLVDFWAEWCGPCKMIGPVIEELAEEYDGKVTFAKVNVDDNPRSSASYGIQSIPTLLLFKGGNPMNQIVGMRPKEELEKALDDLLT